jgi:ATP-dependent Clp protease adaptor protein ClpS
MHQTFNILVWTFRLGSRSTNKMSKLQANDSGASNNNEDLGSGDNESGTATISKPKSEIKTPSFYRVIIMNDDFTPMDFVIHVLQKFFQKDYTEATRIMMEVHQQGAGVCGVFTYEVAEMKAYQVNQYARKNKHPLKCSVERV